MSIEIEHFLCKLTLLTLNNAIRAMSKVFHPQVASVLQSALREFRRVSHMKVVEMCAAGAAQSRFIFYSV